MDNSKNDLIKALGRIDATLTAIWLTLLFIMLVIAFQGVPF